MLRDSLRSVRIVLASGSPRRQQFFRDLDVDFEIRVREVDEVYPPELAGAQIPEFLCRLKADAFADLAPDELLVTSDTIVWHKGRALGKPDGFDDALRILTKLQGDTHEVITSVCFKTTRGMDVITETTRVTFNPLDQASLRYYLEHYRPYDKAGAYGIQDWIGLVGVARIEGSYANVMGMPVDRVFQYLKSFRP